MPAFQPAPPPAPPAPQPIEFPVTIQQPGAVGAQEVYEGMVAQRKELRNQLDRLEDQRRDLSNELRSENITTSDRTGVEARLKETDARISSVEGQIAQADLAVAKAAAIPGAIVERPPIQRDGPPEELVAIPIVFIMFVLGPLAIAYARRIWKRGATVIAPVPREVHDRLDQMAQSIESIAIETERIGEGQRFLTRVMSEQNRLGAGPAQPIAVPVAEHEQVKRG
ncbi:hypothetical protein [Gemmatimonas aurantiaca]|nr:hypothetical protein [Gemmatimonas aurantiaca]